MELERMGFDLTLLAYVILGNSILVVGGACLVAYLKRVIERWEEAQAAGAYQSAESNAHVSTSMMPVSQEPRVRSNQQDRRPVFMQTPVHATA